MITAILTALIIITVGSFILAIAFIKVSIHELTYPDWRMVFLNAIAGLFMSAITTLSGIGLYQLVY